MKNRVTGCCIAAVLLLVSIRVTADPIVPLRIGRQKQLFVDNYIVERMEGVHRTLNQPEKHPGNPVLAPDRPWEGRRARWQAERMEISKERYLYNEIRERQALGMTVSGNDIMVEPERGQRRRTKLDARRRAAGTRRPAPEAARPAQGAPD